VFWINAFRKHIDKEFLPLIFIKKRFINNNNVNLYRVTTLGGRHYMVRWKLFGRSKPKEEEPEGEEPIQEEPKETMQSDTEQEPEKPAMPEYRETLYTEGSIPKKDKTYHKKETINQTTWRDINAIEENVDNLSRGRAKKPISGLDEKVNKILSKRKKK